MPSPSPKRKRVTARRTAPIPKVYTDSSDESEDERGPTAEEKPVLERMYETSDWSDLTIQAGDGKVFKVHKTVVYPASPYFNEACTAGARETHTNHVNLPESTKTVDAILRHFYKTPALWTRRDFHDQEVIETAAAEGADLIALRVAVNKYDIDSMIADVEDAFAALLEYYQNHNDFKSLIWIGQQIFDEEDHFLYKMRRAVASTTAKFVSDILEHEPSSEGLRWNSDYLRQTMLQREASRPGLKGKDRG
ncbi:hypothetical protein CBER1_11540 [Cercospora berteroae]|uniref:BTB domain-containing protein n=1 Tax=Cercospora berteroae TaxID=357750 RepID=A0A2S6CM48_9PEZI|nr:hypothetical protein CBER1_11540 [Cercospora berteroae]